MSGLLLATHFGQLVHPVAAEHLSYIYCCVITGLGVSSLGHCILLDNAQMLVQNHAADADKQDATNGFRPAPRESSHQPTDHDA